MRDLGSGGVADEDRDTGVERLSDVGEDVFCDSVVFVDHTRVCRVVGVCLNAAHGDRVGAGLM